MQNQTASAPTHLRCEYLDNPRSIDVLAPRLSWRLSDARRGARQSAYQLLVASSQEVLATGQGDLWDSGRVESAQSVHVPYQGVPLISRQRVYWQVRSWDADGQPSPWSDPACWEMGLLQRDDWLAQWIGTAHVGGKFTYAPCPFLRKELTIAQPIVSARLYVTALGLYEMHLNGECVGDAIFTPGATTVQKRVQYQVYDVTGMLHEGNNALGAVLADGWYCGNISIDRRQHGGDRPKLFAQLEVTLADGTRQTLSTDATWTTATGPYLLADFQEGEHYDARFEMPGWDQPGFSEDCWRPALVFDDPGIALVATRSEPVRLIQELHPITEPLQRPWSWQPMCYVYDMGQNMVGRVRIKVSGKAGTTVRLRFAEMLNPDQSIYTTNLRAAAATDYYILSGNGEEIYEPAFTFHGFRYVEVYGLPDPLPPEAITGVVLHSDMPLTGDFSTSDVLVNQLQHNILWGQKGNFLEIPTDCPQRDERLGWTGDAQVFIRTAAFNMQVAPFFTKWLQAMEDIQTPDGAIATIVPTVNGDGHDGGPAWADAAVICPWTIYLCYGDKQLLAERYGMMTRFVGFLEQTHRDYIRNYQGYNGCCFGDWLSTNAVTPNDLIGTAFFAYSTALMAKIAGLLGHADDAEHFTELHGKVRDAFRRRFVTPDGLLACGTQTAYILAIYFELLDPEQLQATGAELVRDIESRGWHLSTGFVGTPYIAQALSKVGRLDVAYTLLKQTTFPSWLYSVTQGATTIWERWDGWTHDKGFQDPGMNSFNHYAYGAIGAWLYAEMAGLELDAEHPGYAHAIIRPKPGGEFTQAQASIESMYGKVASNWQIADGTFTLTVEVPPNTTAAIYLPVPATAPVQESGLAVAQAPGVTGLPAEDGTAAFTVGAGRYCFTFADCQRICN